MPHSKHNSTERFSTRVENYIKYRPSYPVAIIDVLKKECQLSSHSRIADIGAGTGILSEMLLRVGSTVFAVEPNREMREAAERIVDKLPGFVAVNGTAEATTLANQSVDLITAAQAFHWFNREETRKEFVRILKPGGWVVLIWNERLTTTNPFLKAYEKLLHEFATDYEQVNHVQIDAAVVQEFFGSQNVELKTFPNQQEFDYAGVEGRLLSSSYAPEQGHANHQPMMTKLREIYNKYQENDRIVFEYKTQMYLGRF